jgi:hypothetical protein
MATSVLRRYGYVRDLLEGAIVDTVLLYSFAYIRAYYYFIVAYIISWASVPAGRTPVFNSVVRDRRDVTRRLKREPRCEQHRGWIAVVRCCMGYG